MLDGDRVGSVTSGYCCWERLWSVLYILYDTSCVNRPKTTTRVGHGEELPMHFIGFVAPDRPLDRSEWISTLRNKMLEC